MIFFGFSTLAPAGAGCAECVPAAVAYGPWFGLAESGLQIWAHLSCQCHGSRAKILEVPENNFFLLFGCSESFCSLENNLNIL